MELLNIAKFGGKYELDVAGTTLELTQEDVSRLRAGSALPDGSPLSKALTAVGDKPLVIYTNILMQKDGPYLDDIQAVAFAIQKSYPSVMVIRDPISDATAQRVTQLAGLNLIGPTDTVALIAPDSFGVTDYKIIQNIAGKLRTAGVKVVNVGDNSGIHWEEKGGKLLIVITGHIDEKLARFVRVLGESGVFKDNYVLFNSCNAPLNTELATEIATKYGAVGAFTYEGKISDVSLERAMVDFSDGLSNGKPVRFRDVLLDNLRKNGLNGVWTVCRSASATDGSDGLSRY